MRALILTVFAVGCAASESPADRASEADPGLAAKDVCHVNVPGDHATVQDAVDAAADGETICIGAGTFVGLVDIESRDLRLVGRGPGRTTLDGGGLGSTIHTLLSTVEMEGFTVTGGLSASWGGGIDVDESSTVDLEDITIKGNEAATSGGGMHVVHSTVTADNVKILGNHAGNNGGGFAVSEGTFIGEEVIVANNTAGEEGGGIDLGRAGATITGGAIVNNEVLEPGGYGGGLNAFTGGVTLTNVLVAGNVAPGWGGGLALTYLSDGALTNSVVRGNTAEEGGALFVDRYAEFAVTNTVITANAAALGVGGVHTEPGARVTYSHNDFWKNSGTHVTVGEPDPVGVDGNLAVNPMFVSTAGRNPARWDLHLQPGSPLIDAGDPTITDLDGTVSDIGLYGGPHAD